MSAQLCAGWVVERGSDSTSTFNIHGGEGLELDGALHDDLWGNRTLLRSLAPINSVIADFLLALECGLVKPTVGEALRGRGWGTLFLELTGQCNERCVHCYASASPEVTQSLSWPDIERVLREAADLGFSDVQFTGGDPLISEHLVGAVQLASRLSFKQLEVYTNGLAFRQELLELFSLHKVGMALSLYSHRADVHDRVTKTPGSHARTSDAIERALGADLSVRVAGIQGCDNEQDESKLVQYLRELGVPESGISSDRQRPVGRGSLASEVEIKTVHGVGHAAVGLSDRGKLCVSYSGKVLPCIFDRSVSFGNVAELGLRGVLERPIEVGKLSRRSLEIAEGSLACGSCRNRRELLERCRW